MSDKQLSILLLQFHDRITAEIDDLEQRLMDKCPAIITKTSLFPSGTRDTIEEANKLRYVVDLMEECANKLIVGKV